MAELRHDNVKSNGIRIHVAEQGQGPLVILVHGFPESWYSWREQLPALAQAGYRAAAIDVRGYGRSSKPVAIEDYRMVLHVGDIVGLVEALGEEKATLIGHDWGAPIVWNSALIRPDLFRGVAGLSVPYTPRTAAKPSSRFKTMGGQIGEFYIEYFQQPGRAEGEIEKDVRRWLLGFYFSASGEADMSKPPIAVVEHGKELAHRFQFPETMPEWLTEADLDYYAGEFERTGLTGGLNRYRNIDRDWEDLAAYDAQPITIPALFVGGSKDGPTMWGRKAIEGFPNTLPKLKESIVLEGCGHWIQQERPEETNKALVRFLDGIH